MEITGKYSEKDERWARAKDTLLSENLLFIRRYK
jgi:hypothetical protein